MKRTGAIIATVALLITMAASTCFAAEGLTIEETYPKDGSKGASIENLGVKIQFSEDLSEDIVGEANKDCFQLLGPDGKELPTRILYNDKEVGVVLVLLDNTGEDKTDVTGKTDYTLWISGDVVDDKGNTLGEDTEITFTTLNQQTNTLISVLMMVVMFGGMMVISTRAAKKAAADKTGKQDDRVNPYKEAKRTGKSVEEIVEKDNKRKAKQAEALEKQKAKEAELEAELEAMEAKRREKERAASAKKVSAPRPISAAGSQYKVKVVKTQEPQQEQKQQNKKGSTNPKNQTGKQKNSKNKGRKK